MKEIYAGRDVLGRKDDTILRNRGHVTNRREREKEKTKEYPAGGEERADSLVIVGLAEG